MAALMYPRRGFGLRPRKTPAAPKRTSPSTHLINAVLEHADLRDELGGGRVLLRVSSAKQRHPDVRADLGDEARRLADIAVVWDEREDQVFRVLDGKAARAPALEVVEEDRFELTPAAYAYIAAHGSKR